MPRNTFGGNKAKKGKNYINQKELMIASIDQEYAEVMKTLGSRRFEVSSNNKTRLAHLRGNMRRGNWVNPGDFVLISLRDYQDNKCDILHKYSSEDLQKLKKLGEISNIVQEKIAEECSFSFDEI